MVRRRTAVSVETCTFETMVSMTTERTNILRVLDCLAYWTTSFLHFPSDSSRETSTWPSGVEGYK